MPAPTDVPWNSIAAQVFVYYTVLWTSLQGVMSELGFSGKEDGQDYESFAGNRNILLNIITFTETSRSFFIVVGVPWFPKMPYMSSP